MTAEACVPSPDVTLLGRKCTDSTNWLLHCWPYARAALSTFGGMEGAEKQLSVCASQFLCGCVFIPVNLAVLGSEIIK